MGKVYSPEFKGQVCKRIIEGGEKVSQISIELDLHENTIYNWLNSYRARNGKAFTFGGENLIIQYKYEIEKATLHDDDRFVMNNFGGEISIFVKSLLMSLYIGRGDTI
ncbi:MAG: transposase [Faecalibacterium sp.]|jgi:hypothetical protein|nr:transposase [Faecalibacterium sp.]